jgi:hypothetical protein
MRIVLTVILAFFAAFCCLAFLLCADLKEGWNGAKGCRLFHGTAIVASVVALKTVWRVKTR